MGDRRGPRLGMGAVVAAVLLAGCGGAAGTGAGPEPETVRGEVRAVELGALTAADIARSQTLFGLDLLHAMCAASPGENVVISPTSAATALGMLYPAAAGSTAERLGSMLHLPPWSADVIAAVHEHTRSLSSLAYDGDPDDAPDFVTVSNRIWPAAGLVPEPAYLDDVATAFDAGVHPLDYAADAAAATDTINRAVSDDTAGIIDELFADPLRPNTVVVLTNAVHLKARWAVPFTDTRDAPFRTLDGETTAPMMSGGAGTVQSVQGWQSVRLAYADGTLAAQAVLPPEGTDPCTLDADRLAALRDADEMPTDVVLPRMRLDQDHDLLAVLTELGLEPDGDYPAFGGMQITDVVQSTFLDVDEQGTEAAAATGVAGEESLRPTVTLDRPFLLVLTDTATGSPLFVAAIHDPSR